MVDRRLERAGLWEIPTLLQQIGRRGEILSAQSDDFGSILKSHHVDGIYSHFVGSTAEQLAEDQHLTERLRERSSFEPASHISENIEVMQRELFGNPEYRDWPAFVYASSHWIVGPWFQKQNGGLRIPDEFKIRTKVVFHEGVYWEIRDGDFSLRLPIGTMKMFDPFNEQRVDEKEMWVTRRLRVTRYPTEDGSRVFDARSDEYMIGVGHVGYSQDVSGDEIPGAASMLINPKTDIDLCYFEIPNLHFVLVDPTFKLIQPYVRVSLGYAGGYALKNIAVEFGNFADYPLYTCGADTAFANGFCNA